MTDLDRLWLRALEEVTRRAAHEVKDALNGVSLNLEVIRSRLAGGGAAAGQTVRGADLTTFAAAASEQFERLVIRTEALLFLSRPASDPADVAVVLRHLAVLLVPATKADGGQLTLEGTDIAALTTAPAKATRLALASALLATIGDGTARPSARCRLESGLETVVRFSHESAESFAFDPAVRSELARHSIRSEASGSDLILRFPGH